MSSAAIVPVLVNGEPLDCISSLDRGLLYGDGVFETLRVSGGQPRFWRRHMARLQAGCARLDIPCPDTGVLHHELMRLSGAAGRCLVKIMVTRGAGGRGYRVPDTVRATRIIQRHGWPDYPDRHGERGVAIRLCDRTLGSNPQLAGIKHLNRLEQILARREWDDPEIMEGLLRDAEGRLIEGTMSNLFLVRDQVVLTPDLSRCGVAGIIRSVTMDLARRLSLPVMVKDIGYPELLQADEVFLTNSVIGIWPVIAVAGSIFSKGRITHQLQRQFAWLQDEGEAWYR